jgi:hypothetical protein
METDPEIAMRLLRELAELNANLRESKQSMQTLCNHLKDAMGNAKALYSVGKQINILNQILLQIGKRAGMAGMLENLLRAVATFAKAAK